MIRVLTDTGHVDVWYNRHDMLIELYAVMILEDGAVHGHTHHMRPHQAKELIEVLQRVHGEWEEDTP